MTMENTDLSIRYLAFASERIAREHGWWEDDDRDMGNLLMLVVTELAEAFEEIRDNRDRELIYADLHSASFWVRIFIRFKKGFMPLRNISPYQDEWIEQNIKPEGFMVEIADVMIRLFDFIEHYKLTPVLLRALRLKLAFNEGRPYRHGGKAS